MTPGSSPGESEAASDQRRGRVIASDAMVLGHESGRVLSDGHIVGRGEPYIKVFEGSRLVKRSVGAVAWAVLEDIGLDARLDDRGRLVAETNIRRIAENLNISKNTVVEHLGRLKQFGFVLREERKRQGRGRYSASRYVLDPSACIERFTVTPLPRASQRPPRRKSWDVDAASQSTGTGGLGRKTKDVVDVQNNNADDDLTTRLVGAGVAPAVAKRLTGEFPAGLIERQLDALPHRPARNPAGVLVSSIRGDWPMPPQTTLPTTSARLLPTASEDDPEAEAWDRYRAAVAHATHELGEDELSSLRHQALTELRRHFGHGQPPAPMVQAAVDALVARQAGIPVLGEQSALLSEDQGLDTAEGRGHEEPKRP